MKKIIYTPAPGKPVSVVTAAPGARLCASVTRDGAVVTFDPPVAVEKAAPKWRDASPVWAETEDDFLARVAARDVPPGIAWSLVDEGIIPADRTFRDAWVPDGLAIGIDMARARDVKRAHIRAERKPRMEAKDVEYMRAMEAGDSARMSAIAAEKQRLRDAPAHSLIATAATPEDLKKLTLDALISP